MGVLFWREGRPSYPLKRSAGLLFSLQQLTLIYKLARYRPAYSLNWGAWEIWGKGGGETLALLMISQAYLSLVRVIG